MTAAALDNFSTRLPDEKEIANAEQLRQIMASLISENDPTTLEVVHERGQPAQPITLTPAIAQTFLEVLRLISSGSGFRVIPVTAELTTQQAADLLNVSRPFLIKLLEEQTIPHTKVGRHRRVKADDLFAFKVRRDTERNAALADMAALDAEAGLL